MSHDRKFKRSFKNFLLDPGFQLKYAILIALSGGVIFGSMAWLFYDQVRENSQLVALDALAAQAAAQPAAVPVDPGKPTIKIDSQPLKMVDPKPASKPAKAADQEFESLLKEGLAAEDTPLLWTLSGFMVLLVVALFLIGILATHRIVGPIYVVDIYVRKIMNGEPVRPRPLRRGDEFQSLFIRVNEMATRLRQDRLDEIAAIEKATAALRAHAEGAGDERMLAWVEEDLEPIKALVAAKQEYLEGSAPD